MITLITTLWASKLGKWLIEVVLILALFFGYSAYEHHQGASDELAKLKNSSTALIARANDNIAHETAAHAADVKANQEKTDAALQVATAANNALVDSVQRFDAYRRLHPDVPRTGGGPSATSPGECGAVSCGELASQLAKVGDELAASQGALVATLEGCQRDRDSLTGLPK